MTWGDSLNGELALYRTADDAVRAEAVYKSKKEQQ